MALFCFTIGGFLWQFHMTMEMCNQLYLIKILLQKWAYKSKTYIAFFKFIFPYAYSQMTSRTFQSPSTYVFIFFVRTEFSIYNRKTHNVEYLNHVSIGWTLNLANRFLVFSAEHKGTVLWMNNPLPFIFESFFYNQKTTSATFINLYLTRQC